MDWLNGLNEALLYIEKQLKQEIDLAQAAKLACCSTYHFQRMFSYIAGVSLSEYIRRRRMTLAAFDLQNGARVLDTALRYGYESPTSFHRAFRSVHGIAPSAARKKGASLKSYSRISFKVSVSGDAQTEYRIEYKEAFRIIGLKMPLSKNVEEGFSSVPPFGVKLWRMGYCLIVSVHLVHSRAHLKCWA